MTNEEIKTQIDANNKAIRDLLTPNQFVLNNTIRDLVESNKKLQQLCTHHFEDGYCEYCYSIDPAHEQQLMKELEEELK